MDNGALRGDGTTNTVEWVTGEAVCDVRAIDPGVDGGSLHLSRSRQVPWYNLLLIDETPFSAVEE